MMFWSRYFANDADKPARKTRRRQPVRDDWRCQSQLGHASRRLASVIILFTYRVERPPPWHTPGASTGWPGRRRPVGRQLAKFYGVVNFCDCASRQEESIDLCDSSFASTNCFIVVFSAQRSLHTCSSIFTVRWPTSNYKVKSLICIAHSIMLISKALRQGITQFTCHLHI